MAAEPSDHIARLRAAWARERPDIDTEGLAVLGRVRRIVLAARGPVEAVFARFDLDAGEFDVLASLRRAGAPYRLRPTELFQVLMISSGGLTDRLSRLDRRGLIARVPSDADRRSLMVELTEAGRKLVEAAFEADMAVERGLLDGLSAAEREALAALLAKLAASVEAKAG